MDAADDEIDYDFLDHYHPEDYSLALPMEPCHFARVVALGVVAFLGAMSFLKSFVVASSLLS